MDDGKRERGEQVVERKEELLNQILPIEWQMFSQVNEGVAPQASCQRMPRTFAIMRAAQALTWNVGVMESYLADLTEAVREGRNLMTEKYARMMRLQGDMPEDTSAVFADVPPGVRARIDRIVDLSMDWRRQAANRYPKLVARGRVLDAGDEASGQVSFETYLRGELETYSPRTISLYTQMVEAAESAGVNLEEQCLGYMVSAYGYRSLEEAERNL